MTKHDLNRAKSHLMVATRTGKGLEEARAEFETVRVLYYLETNRDRIKLADTNKIREALNTLETN